MRTSGVGKRSGDGGRCWQVLKITSQDALHLAEKHGAWNSLLIQIVTFWGAGVKPKALAHLQEPGAVIEPINPDMEPSGHVQSMLVGGEREGSSLQITARPSITDSKFWRPLNSN